MSGEDTIGEEYSQSFESGDLSKSEVKKQDKSHQTANKK